MSILKLLKPVAALLSYVNYKRDRLRLEKLMGQGLKVGKNVYIMEEVEFDLGYPHLIEIGDNCRIAKGVRFLSHDATTFRDLGVTRLAQVKILEGTWIGERVIILPGVTLGPRALIAAGSVVNRDIGEDKVAAGNPARPYGSFSELLNKYRDMAVSGTVFKKEEIESGIITKKDIIEELERSSTVFIRGVPKEDPYYINADFNEMRENALYLYNELTASKADQVAKVNSVTKKATGDVESE